jgi:hypothetical protein
MGLSLKYNEDGLHALLDGALRWIPIALMWKYCSDLLNLSPTSYGSSVDFA